MGKRSRDKGKRGEREACDVLRPIFPEVRRRAMQARGGSEGADLEGTPGYHVEVGVGRTVSAHAKWEQARRDKGACPWEADLMTCRDDSCPACTDPIAMTRKDRGPWLVTMEAGAWVELVRIARKAQETRKTDGEPGTSQAVASRYGARGKPKPPF